MNAPVDAPVDAPGPLALRELSYAEAIREALGLAMERDPRVILMGEDIGVYGGAFGVTGDLIERFGPDRVMDTPISELGGAGVAVGAAMTGLRPIYEFQFSDFAALAMEQIVNQAAKMRYMLGGEAAVPVVFRMPSGSGTGAAAQHSQSFEVNAEHVERMIEFQGTSADEPGRRANDQQLIARRYLSRRLVGDRPVDGDASGVDQLCGLGATCYQTVSDQFYVEPLTSHRLRSAA